MQHIINKQIIDLRIAKNLDAFRIQQAVSDHYRQHLMPLLEKEFDSIAGPDEAVLIDRMEIDLGELTEAEIANVTISDYITNKIIKQVAENLKSSNTSGENVSVRKAAGINSSRQWLFYMEKGYLPWSLLQITERWHTQVQEALATDYNSIEELRKMILNNKNIAQRIVHQHPTSFLVKLTAILTAENQSTLQDAIAEIQTVLNVFSGTAKATGQIKEISEKQLWQEVVATAALQSNIKSTVQISEALLKNHVPMNESATKENIAAVKPQVKILLPAILQMEKEISAKSKLKNEDVRQKKNDAPKEELPAADQSLLKKDDTDETSPIRKDAVHEINEEGIFIQHAGLVLIHPFLATLLNRLGLVSEKKFIDGQAREKALFLLHYIVTGSAVAEEHELLLPKILCGHSLEEPVAKEMQFSDEEREEADSLLKAVIGQWSILKNTSPEGLRETFLKRSGKVFTKNDSIHIQVESGPVDMLLDHLPWNLSIIKLPWIKDIIKVEWR
jgi:hypothetical protein